MPFVNPLTVCVRAPPVDVFPPGLDVTVKLFNALVPDDAGGRIVTVAAVFPGTTLANVGALGAAGTTSVGAMAALGSEGDDVRLSTLVAVTVNVYRVPLVKPGTVIVMGELALKPVANAEPGEAWTLYEVMSLEPELMGALNVTTACALPRTTTTLVGFVGGLNTGTVTGVPV